MTPQQSYLEFAPPPTPGLLRGVLLALLAHGVLLAILTVGVQWKREAPLVTAEAELWSALPQEAAPPAPPPEPPAPEPEPAPQKVAPPPKPLPVVAPPQPDPSIAIEREKTKQLKERQQRDLQEKEAKLLEKKLAAKATAEKLEKAKAQKAKDLDEAKKAQAAKDDKEAKDAKAKAQAQEPAANAKKLAEVRAAALKRMAALAAGSGNDNSQGSSAQSSGPSAGYGGRIRARIKPNITFTDTISGNPLAEVEVRTSPDGTIISRRLTKPSGMKSWDDAVLSAIDKTEVLPRDVDGRVPPTLVISFRPRD